MNVSPSLGDLLEKDYPVRFIVSLWMRWIYGRLLPDAERRRQICS
jgi:hypothetical protein